MPIVTSQSSRAAATASTTVRWNAAGSEMT